MISFENITTISRYERKILLRSWFFRIFAILSLFIIGMYSGTMLFNFNPFTWSFRSMPSSMIYANMFLLNIFQSVIAVFLATDFMKRDKKLNTSEVLFIRPMTNGEYLGGKTLGLISVFMYLNLLVMLLTSIMLIISDQVEFQLLPILLYFLLVSIPSLVFIIGLSFFVMNLIKNQPIAFILLLGYIALVLFYLGDKVNYLFDYMAFVKPLPYSDIIGFSNPGDVLIHRLSYFLLGIAFIFFTSWRLNRLPNKQYAGTYAAVLMLVFALLAGAGFFQLYKQHRQTIEMREQYSVVASDWYKRAVPQLKACNIELEHAKNMKASAEMLLFNDTGSTLDTLFFTINPGFKVESVNIAGEEIAEFSQRLQLVFVPLERFMTNGEELTVTIHYSGLPDQCIAYLDTDDEDFLAYDRFMNLRIDRQYGFYSDDYVLLTKELLWYPLPGVFYDPLRPAIFRQQFTRFNLKVKTSKGLLPQSQGSRTSSDSLTYEFEVRDPLPQLSLAIGRYVEKKIDLDGIAVKLAHIEGHDFYTRHLSALQDTLSDLLFEFLDDYERPLGLYYPYQNFSLVEVPVQFATQAHTWTSAQAHNQPQIIHYPEWGFNLRQADFKSSARQVERNSERNNEGLSEAEIQARVFTGFLRSTFAAEDADMRFGQQDGQAGKANPYSIFPNYYYYVNYISSDECPVINYAFESYLMKGEDNPRQMFMSRMSGLGDNELANQLLKERSLKQIIAEVEDQQDIARVLRAKGAYLLTWMEKQIDDPQFEQYLLDYLYNNSYRNISYEELAADLSKRFDTEMGSFIADWYNTTGLPAFGVGTYQVFETIDQSQAVFLVRTKVTNYSDVDGMVKFTFQTGGGGGGRGGFFGAAAESEPEERIYLVDAGQTKEIQMLLYEAPRSVIFNSLLSENIPSSMMQFGLNAEKNNKLAAEEYERVVDQPVELYNENELIVDNRDAGFTSYDPALENPLRKFVESRKKEESSEFVGQGFGQAPASWSLSPDAGFFGKIEHSAMIIRSGDGSKKASWSIALPDEAYYDVYVYLNAPRRFGPRRGRGGDDGSYHYIIPHADGTEEIELKVDDFEDGWNLLGSFYLSGDSAMVTLTDAGGASRVVADAVKWVKQK
jgi:ABC-type transport system involved in multi-copper enzyme maturation permease subunit